MNYCVEVLRDIFTIRNPKDGINYRIIGTYWMEELRKTLTYPNPNSLGLWLG